MSAFDPKRTWTLISVIAKLRAISPRSQSARLYACTRWAHEAARVHFHANAACERSQRDASDRLDIEGPIRDETFECSPVAGRHARRSREHQLVDDEHAIVELCVEPAVFQAHRLVNPGQAQRISASARNSATHRCARLGASGGGLWVLRPIASDSRLSIFLEPEPTGICSSAE